MDEHEDKVFSYTNRLRQLLEESQPTTGPTLKINPSQHLHRRIREVDREAGKVGEDVEGLEVTSCVDQCQLRQLENRIDSLISELQDVCRGILLLDHDSEVILQQGSSLKKVLYTLDFKLICLLRKQGTSPSLLAFIRLVPG